VGKGKKLPSANEIREKCENGRRRGEKRKTFLINLGNVKTSFLQKKEKK